MAKGNTQENPSYPRGIVFIDSPSDAPHTTAHLATYASSVRATALVFSVEGLQQRRTIPGSGNSSLLNRQQNPPPVKKTTSSPMPTPVVICKLASLLIGFGKKDYIVEGFSNGFRIHFDGPEVPTYKRNSREAEQNPQAIDSKLKEELEAGQIQGPQPTI